MNNDNLNNMYGNEEQNTQSNDSMNTNQNINDMYGNPPSEPAQPVVDVKPETNEQPAENQNPAPAQQPVATQTAAAQEPVKTQGSFGWAILGFFIPIVGWILYFSWKNTKPGDAKMAGIGGTVGFILNLILLNMN